LVVAAHLLALEFDRFLSSHTPPRPAIARGPTEALPVAAARLAALHLASRRVAPRRPSRARS
jgi:hypothetical protein